MRTAAVPASDTDTLTLVVDATPGSIEFGTTYRSTRELAEADLARFPKSAKLRVTTLSGRGGDWKHVDYYLTGRVVLAENGVNGGKNETGIKRYRSTVKAADRIAAPVVFETGDRATFEASL